MSLPKYEDGCIRPNIVTRRYLVLFKPVCPHKKLSAAIVAIEAPDEGDAMTYACDWIRLAGLVPVSVTEAVAHPSMIK